MIAYIRCTATCLLNEMNADEELLSFLNVQLHGEIAVCKCLGTLWLNI